MTKPIAQFDTFLKFDSYQQGRLEQKKPDVFNGTVSIRRYRITVEEVVEPVEVLRLRLQKLWYECDNHHHWGPLQAVAKELGFELTHESRAAAKEQDKELTRKSRK